ncbi:Cytokinesis protein Don1 [Rhodotorula toruloides ATCC 204091]|uniref:Cytokinesis protein Don1 n=1 Tax=Rhodotorula toruloides TaxID=5286 RepID=A0A0K3CL99_RHOTO|nr:Cytokinesis protein Don1 [Rhodotorula toruloides ATCC 204091]KAK4330378.1 Cytokinesis protein Don1 [Rhodotorula toruloides]PRQ71027.1 cytokinesis protein Don1 [Rhodotorula toruloides]
MPRDLSSLTPLPVAPISDDCLSKHASAPPAVLFPSSPAPPNEPTFIPFPTRSKSPPACSSRLSVASNASSKRDSTLVSGPRPPFLRQRQTSLPASLVASRHYSFAGNLTSGANRFSVASFSSCESVAEEEDIGERPNGGQAGKAIATGQSASSPASRRSSISSKRYSVSPLEGQYQSFASASVSADALDNSSKSSVSSDTDAATVAKRNERRWRIAEELRDTEQGYVAVLEEVDELYYQPLLSALPTNDPLARRSSKRYSAMSAGSTPSHSPRHSLDLHTQSTARPAPRTRTSTADSHLSDKSSPTATTAQSSILRRREINEIFSNFADVLNLSRFMLATMEEAIPPRPSQPVPLVPAHESTTSSTASRSAPDQATTAAFSASADSRSSSPFEGIPSSRPRQRTLSTRSDASRRRRQPAPPFALGKALLPVLPFLKQYSLFCANYGSALSRLARLEQSSIWREFVAKQEKLQAGKIGLAGLLLSIVQRVPRYRLLLQELVEYTDDDHPDATDLEAAFALVDQVATHLDAQIASHTHSLELLDLQRSFHALPFTLLEPGRRLIKSESLVKIAHSGKEEKRQFLLFSDILIEATQEDDWSTFASASGATFTFRHRFELDDITVVANEETSEEGVKKYGIEVLSSQQSFLAFADSGIERDIWLDTLRTAKAQLMSDRTTLQRTTSLSSAPPRRANLRNDRRISLPPAATPTPFTHNPPSLSHLVVPSRQISLPPALGYIPPTPNEELDKQLQADDRQLSHSPLSSPTLPPAPAHPSFPRQSSAPAVQFTAEAALLATSTSTSTPTPGRPSLSRARRWSEAPSIALQALSSALALDPLTDVDAVEYPVVDEYRAPVWVPDSKASRCMNCRTPFGLWRRKHHCRLCGNIMCFACSNKYFLIPASLLSGSSGTFDVSAEPDRLARSCDTCYASLFLPSSPSASTLSRSSRLLASRPAPADPEIAKLPPTIRVRSGTGKGRVLGAWDAAGGGGGTWKGTWSKRRVGEVDWAALRDVEGAGSEPVQVPARKSRARRESVVDKLRGLLARGGADAI